MSKIYGVHILCFIFLTIQLTKAQLPCLTPTGAYGQCVPYRRCTYIVQLMDDWINRFGGILPDDFRAYLFDSRCGDPQEIEICCDLRAFAMDVNTYRTIPSTDRSVISAPRTIAQDSDLNDYEASLNSGGVAVLDSQECGRSNADKIAFGEKANLFAFPWMALLRYDDNETPFKCGGTLITNRYVLTAAHCVVRSGFKLVGVRLGEHNIDTENDCQIRGPEQECAPPVEDVGVEKVISHPEYSRTKLTNDVALVKLNTNVQFARHIKPICLPITRTSAAVPQDNKYIIAGWGTTENGAAFNVLMKATIPHVTRDKCQSLFKRTRIADSHVCAGGDGPVSVCKGDSGGPLFYVSPYKRGASYVQYGIVSFGGPICGTNKTIPGLFANVVSLMPWITSNIE